MSKLTMGLLENSVDYFVESVASALAAENSPKKWKYATLFMVQSVELVLKEILNRVNPILVYADLDKRKETVSARKALERIKAGSMASLPDADLDRIVKAITWRNEITHFRFEVDTDHLKANYACLLGFYLDISQSALQFDPKDHLQRDLLGEVMQINEYRTELSSRAQERIDREDIDPACTWPCPACGLSAFVAQNRIDTCYACGYQEQIVHCDECQRPFFESQASSSYCGNFRRLHMWRTLCPDCERRVLASVLY